MAAALQGSILCTAQGSCCQRRAAARTEFQGSQHIASSLSANFRHNEVRLASQVLSELEFRAPPQRRRQNVVVQASFKDMVKSVLRFAANSPLRFLIKKLDHELEEAEEKIKAGASIIKGMADTVEKIADAGQYAAHEVEELVEKIEKNVEKLDEELDELLEEVEEEKKAVKVLEEKVEKAETEIIEKQMGKKP